MTFRISRPAALTSLALAMAACYAHAEPADTVVVTATRTPQPLANVISDTITISAEQISESGAGSIVDLLQRQRGIEIARNGGAGTIQRLHPRRQQQPEHRAGGRRAYRLLDHRRRQLERHPADAIDHIEIVYGPLSSCTAPTPSAA
jgi:vitamin B12 transporter